MVFIHSKLNKGFIPYFLVQDGTPEINPGKLGLCFGVFFIKEGRKEGMKKLKKFVIYLSVIGLAFCFSMSAFITAPEIAQAGIKPVKLNEFMPKPLSGNEWVELYNPNKSPVDISNYAIEDAAANNVAIPASTVIAGYGFYVVDLGGAPMLNDTGGDTVYLLDDLGATVDLPPPTYSNDATLDRTYARSADGGGTWSNGTTDPTKGASNDTTAPTSSGGCVLDGPIVGEDVDYIATKTQLSANWKGCFEDDQSVIISYEYTIYEAGTPIFTKITKKKKFTKKKLTLTEGTLYTVGVKATNNAALTSGEVLSDGQTPDVTGPIKPTNLVIASTDKPYDTDGVVHLSWTGSNDGTGSGMQRYDVYRSTSPAQKIGSVNHQLGQTDYIFTDSSITGDGINVVYHIVAVDKIKNTSLNSDPDETIVDTVAPAAPTISFSRDNGIVKINWSPVPGAINYEVHKEGNSLIYSGPETSYTDYSTVNGMTYRYWVKAVDAAENKSESSNILEVYIPSPRVSTISTTRAEEAIGGPLGVEKVEAAEEAPSEEAIEEDGEVKGEEEGIEEVAEEAKTNWSLIIAIIIAAAIVIGGGLYWWYAKEEEEI